MEKKVPVEDLAIGMFVAELDRPWLDTPFLIQGFVIDAVEQIDTLRRYCRFVYVDPLRSVGHDGHFRTTTEEITGSSRALPLSWPFDTQDIDAPNWNLAEYLDQVAVETELPRAKIILAESELAVSDLFDNLHRTGSIEPAQVQQVIEPMVQSVVRNPDALTLLARIRRKSHYAYAHAINVSIHMLAFGRHLGFQPDDLQRLGTGGLLLDVGTVNVPGELLSRQGKLTEDEYQTIQRHVEYGLSMLEASWGSAGMVVEMVRGHHEREDGSGYPKRLFGPQIPVPAKMAAIVDCFDALTSVRPYARTHTPYDALQMLYEWRKQTLNSALVEEFIQSLGIYPVGGLVELNSGEVGLVVAHNRVRRLKPRILILLDPDKKPYRTPLMLDLLNEPKLPQDIPYAITRALEDGMYGLDPRDYYL